MAKKAQIILSDTSSPSSDHSELKSSINSADKLQGQQPLVCQSE